MTIAGAMSLVQPLLRAVDHLLHLYYVGRESRRFEDRRHMVVCFLNLKLENQSIDYLRVGRDDSSNERCRVQTARSRDGRLCRRLPGDDHLPTSATWSEAGIPVGAAARPRTCQTGTMDTYHGRRQSSNHARCTYIADVKYVAMQSYTHQTLNLLKLLISVLNLVLMFRLRALNLWRPL